MYFATQRADIAAPQPTKRVRIGLRLHIGSALTGVTRALFQVTRTCWEGGIGWATTSTLADLY